MKKNVYAVRDDLSMDFEAPFLSSSDIDCLRSVVIQINHDKEQYSNHKSNINPDVQLQTRTLFYLGKYEDGRFVDLPELPVAITRLDNAPDMYERYLVEFYKEKN